MKIRQFATPDTSDVIQLWKDCDLTRPWNDPEKDIARKASYQPELFLVGEVEGKIMASAMVGYDGHRGSIFYLAVGPQFQRMGYGAALMKEAERILISLGCPKLNILVRNTNTKVLAFYSALDYPLDEVVSVGKRLILDTGLRHE
tara:strand:+ start:80 stop:514 length:435 start_codon:yes stop_codon:yes gene_type:complete